MKTFFAPPERTGEAQLQREIEMISKNPVIDGLMNAVGGLLAVLNEQRQILALNDLLLKTMGINDAQQILGARPGEALQCVHAHEMPGGCGTSHYCKTCGATVAIVVSLAKDEPVERTCALQINKKGVEANLCLNIRACPILFGDTRLVLLFLRDITKEQQRATLERVFFHDIRNTIGGLLGTSELLLKKGIKENNDLLQRINALSLRLVKEVEMQRSLMHADGNHYKPLIQSVSLMQVIEDVRRACADHPATLSKLLKVIDGIPLRSFQTDLSLLLRVLGNMTINAFEATPLGGSIHLSVEEEDSSITFSVWNEGVIPEHVALRIFQRYFSTKEGEGRGLGTYSMKLFGEQFLKGKVSMQTSKEEGTTFSLRLPL